MSDGLRVPPPNSGPVKLDQVTPVTIFTGFLGSGKTTIISQLINDLQTDNVQVSYIKNEAGEMDLDAKVLGGKHVVAQELLNGCICCTLMGPFLEAVDEIIDTFHPDRIIVESSGTAEPGNMAVTIGGHPGVFRDGIIEVVDVVNFGGYPQVNEYWKLQTNLTDLVVLNKLEQADQNRLDWVIDRVRDLNNYSPMVKAPHGQVTPEMVFGVALESVDQMVAKMKPEQHNEASHPELAQIVFECRGWINQEKLEQALKELPDNVIRIKGWVKVQDRGLRVLNGVFKRWDWFAPPDQMQNLDETQLLLIGPAIDKEQEKIVESLRSCQIA